MTDIKQELWEGATQIAESAREVVQDPGQKAVIGLLYAIVCILLSGQGFYDDEDP